MRKDELLALAKSSGFPRISVYLPTHHAYPDFEQDPIRYTNALKEAEKHLRERGMRSAAIDELLAPARTRAHDKAFWRYQDEGLGIFIEPGGTKWARLPGSVSELTTVGERFHLLPLLQCISDEKQFHLLAVTRDQVRFFNGREGGLLEVPLEGAPRSIADVTERTDYDDDVGYHSTQRGRAAAGQGAGAAKFHALGESPEDYSGVEFDHFLRDVAKAVDANLSGRSAPLVLAAEPRTLGHLRQHLSYPHITDTDINANPAASAKADLLARSWSIVEPLLHRDRNAMQERVVAMAGGARTRGSCDLEELMRATEESRVAAIFVSPSAKISGRYDEDKRKLRFDDRRETGSEDLLNLLAVKTMLQGGDVFPLAPELAAKTGPAAGLFRY
jgi:hypothetical protein